MKHHAGDAAGARDPPLNHTSDDCGQRRSICILSLGQRASAIRGLKWSGTWFSRTDPALRMPDQLPGQFSMALYPFVP